VPTSRLKDTERHPVRAFVRKLQSAIGQTFRLSALSPLIHNTFMWPNQDQTQQLLDDVKQGDGDAVNRLMDRHRDSLRRMVQMRLDNKIQRRVDVSDVVQDVLVEANRRLQDYLANPQMSFHLWLRQIAKDRIIDAHRRHRGSAKRSVDREKPLAVQAADDHSTMQLLDQLRDPELTPAAAATRQEMAQAVERCIADLGDQDAEIIIMRHYEQLSNQEIAQALGLTEPAASMRYLRAVRRLRELLSGGSSAADSEI
jgi:RNA polymerase sigma-70 factor, ECF subfamily